VKLTELITALGFLFRQPQGLVVAYFLLQNPNRPFLIGANVPGYPTLLNYQTARGETIGHSFGYRTIRGLVKRKAIEVKGRVFSQPTGTYVEVYQVNKEFQEFLNETLTFWVKWYEQRKKEAGAT
jgi:hypothetical protein